MVYLAVFVKVGWEVGMVPPPEINLGLRTTLDCHNPPTSASITWLYAVDCPL